MERLISFESKSLLEADLAQRIAAILRMEIEKKGSATLLLSGGSTPKNLYEKLGAMELDWANVHVGLVDERFVPQTSPYSNETLIRESLMTGNASNAHFHSMVINSMNYPENLQLAITENEVFRNTDVIILGMGDDGHTASLFPNDELSESAANSKELMANTTSPNEPSKRITFCGPILEEGKHIFLMITGSKKLDVLSKSKEKNYPIQQFVPYIEGIYFTENA